MVQGGSGGEAAYASWTATPASIEGNALVAAAAACRDKLHSYHRDAFSGYADRAGLALAERRGDHAILLYRTDNPDISTSCLVRNPQGSTDVDVVDMASGGSDGPALEAPAKSFTQGATTQFDVVSVTDGAVGEAVTGVTIHAGTFTVTASVQNGRYAAWWPGPAFESGPLPPSGEGGPEPILTYDLTLTDGTVIHNARPTLPS